MEGCLGEESLVGIWGGSLLVDLPAEEGEEHVFAFERDVGGRRVAAFELREPAGDQGLEDWQ